MTELESASRAAAGAMGLNPNTEWEKAKTVAEAVLSALGGMAVCASALVQR